MKRFALRIAVVALAPGSVASGGEVPVAIGVDVVQREDVRMGERGNGLGLALEACPVDVVTGSALHFAGSRTLIPTKAIKI